MTNPIQQLDAIHRMLAVGHRNLRIERHTLLLWGLPAGLLLAISENILTGTQFPDITERAIAWLSLIVGVLSLTALADWAWTRHVKAQRDEAWSFLHRPLMKVQWLIMGLAALATFASFFYGGGYMICALWLVFLGLSLYIYGLFSEELLEWVGILCMLIGIGCLAAKLPYATMRWVAAAVFGIGLPLLAALLDRGQHRPAYVRLIQMLGWLTVVLIAPIWLETHSSRDPLPDIAPISLEQYLAQPSNQGERIVLLPAGTPIPVEVEVSSDLFLEQGRPVLPLTLARPIELLSRDGKLTGDARLPGETWTEARQVRWISIPWIHAEISPTRGPLVTSSLVVQLRHR